MENRFVRTLAFVFLPLLICTCGRKSFGSEAELLSYLKDAGNGYHFKESVKGIDYTLTYRPTDMMVAQFLDDAYGTEEVDRLRKKYKDYLYFNLSLSAHGKEILSNNLGGRAQFGAMVHQLTFGMTEKVHLISQKRDTLPLLDYVHPRTYGMGTSTDMLLVYEKDSVALGQEYLLLTIEDLGLNTGEISFKMETKKIRQQPRLNFRQ